MIRWFCFLLIFFRSFLFVVDWCRWIDGAFSIKCSCVQFNVPDHTKQYVTVRNVCVPSSRVSANCLQSTTNAMYTLREKLATSTPASIIASYNVFPTKTDTHTHTHNIRFKWACVCVCICVWSTQVLRLVGWVCLFSLLSRSLVYSLFAYVCVFVHFSCFVISSKSIPLTAHKIIMQSL